MLPLQKAADREGYLARGTNYNAAVLVREDSIRLIFRKERGERNLMEVHFNYKRDGNQEGKAAVLVEGVCYSVDATPYADAVALHIGQELLDHRTIRAKTIDAMFPQVQ